MNLTTTQATLTARLREVYDEVYFVPMLRNKLLPSDDPVEPPAVRTVRCYNIKAGPAWTRPDPKRPKVQQLAAARIVRELDLPHRDVRVIGGFVVIQEAILADYLPTAPSPDPEPTGEETETNDQ